MTFAEALAYFVSVYSMQRFKRDDTITFEELVGGLIGCLAAAIEQCDEDQQARIVEAVHAALDERLADPDGKAKEALN